MFTSSVCSAWARVGDVATFQVIPLGEFDVGRPERWPQWFKPFERFRAASDLTNKDQPFQVNALLYTLGTKAEDALPSLVLTVDEMEVYATATKRLNSGVGRKSSWGVSFSGIWWSFIFGVRSS